jgi:prophage regulatory protein
MKNSALLRPNQVGAQLGCSGKTVLRQVRTGNFPAPVRISPRCVGWPQHVVDEWYQLSLVRTALEFAPKLQEEGTNLVVTAVG